MRYQGSRRIPDLPPAQGDMSLLLEHMEKDYANAMLLVDEISNPEVVKKKLWMEQHRNFLLRWLNVPSAHRVYRVVASCILCALLVLFASLGTMAVIDLCNQPSYDYVFSDTNEEPPRISALAALDSSKCDLLNTASVQELTLLPGIGKTIAERIIAEREKNGNFSFPEDLAVVYGIGQKKIEGIKEYLKSTEQLSSENSH